MRDIQKLIEDVASGEIGSSEALELLSTLPFSDLGFAKIDHHRGLRQGMQEVIYCEGKTIDQIIEIAKNLHANGSDIIGTRAKPEVAMKLREFFPDLNYNELGRVVTLKKKTRERINGKTLILTAGTSDIPIAEEALETLLHFGCEVRKIYDIGVAGVHRLIEYTAEIRSADVVIVVAGMEGALPSLVGGLVSSPVIAVPTSVGYGSSFEGLSALLGMLNSCASGIGVVNIDNGFGAACLAYRILASAGKREKRGISD